MAKEIELKPSKRKVPADFEKRMQICWELYLLCKNLQEAPKEFPKKVFPPKNIPEERGT